MGYSGLTFINIIGLGRPEKAFLMAIAYLVR